MLLRIGLIWPQLYITLIYSSSYNKFIALMMEAASTYETSVNFNQTTRRNNAETDIFTKFIRDIKYEDQHLPLKYIFTWWVFKEIQGTIISDSLQCDIYSVIFATICLYIILIKLTKKETELAMQQRTHFHTGYMCSNPSPTTGFTFLRNTTVCKNGFYDR
jgi:hypothetical protein